MWWLWERALGDVLLWGVGNTGGGEKVAERWGTEGYSIFYIPYLLLTKVKYSRTFPVFVGMASQGQL